MLLSTEAEVEEHLSRLRPRDGDVREYEVAEEALARPALRRMPARQLLVCAAAAGPVLRSAIRSSLGYDPSAWAVVEYVRGPFPPEEPIPAIGVRLLAAVRDIALGEPGEPVAHGLFPGRATKLARLALARWGEYPASVVRRAAENAYGPDRGHLDRSYHAHDAFAGALVHPDVDATDLAERYSRHRRVERGRRSRRKTRHLLAWARRHGYLVDPSACPCGHDRLDVPRNQPAGVALARHWDTVRPLLETVEQDPGRWLGVFRCTRCGRFWAEDSISSGHAVLFFGYPIETDDPTGWLARAEPLDLPPYGVTLR